MKSFQKSFLVSGNTTTVWYKKFFISKYNFLSEIIIFLYQKILEFSDVKNIIFDIKKIILISENRSNQPINNQSIKLLITETRMYHWRFYSQITPQNNVPEWTLFLFYDYT